MKKYCLIGAALLLAALPVGCLPAPPREPPAPVAVHVWTNEPDNGAIQQVAENFNGEFQDSGIRVEFHRYDPGDSTENLKLETGLMAGGRDIDVYLTYTTQALGKRVNSGCALELSGLCERDGFDLETLFTDQVKKFYYQGKPYAVPSTVGKMGIILNKDMFDQAGIALPEDWTFDEFRETAKRLAATRAGGEKVFGVYWNTSANLSEALLHFALPTLGGDLLYKNGGKESNFDDPVIIKALELIDATMNEDHSAPTHIESVTRKLGMKKMFLEGRCAMTVGAWLYSDVLDTQHSAQSFVTAFAPWPVVEQGARNYTQGSFGGNISINPKSAHINESWEFVKWYSTKGNTPLISTGLVPCYTGFTRDEIAAELLKNADGLIDGDSAVALFLNPDNKLSIPVISNRIGEITEIFDAAVERVLTREESAAAALAQAKAEADALLAS